MKSPVHDVSRPIPSGRKRFPARRLFTIAPFVVVAVGAAFLGAQAHGNDGRIPAGVHVGGLDLGDKAPDEARAALERWSAQQQEKTLTLRFSPETRITRVWKPTARKLGLSIDVQATLADALKADQGGTFGQIAGWISGPKTVHLPPRAAVNTAALRSYLAKIAYAIRHKPKNARLVFLAGGGFGIHGDRPGLALDMTASIAAVTQAWNNVLAASPPTAASTESAPSSTPDTAPTPAEPVAMLAAQVVQADLTSADLKQIDGELGGYTTHFGGTGLSRGSNIALAAGHINGTLLRPGEVFSYNKVVGPRIGSAGFKDAPVIIKGELVPGVGGGVCQVSSTLYNAVLLSDLKIVHRAHHAFPVHYLPAGRDATVVDGSIDFQFQNNTPAPIYIAASARGGRLSFRLFGKRTPGREVSIELANHTVQPAPTETLHDPSLPAGRRVIKDKGHRGHRVTVYRVVRENGQVIRKELISRDHYRTFPTIVLVGSRPVASHVRVRRAAAPSAQPTAPPVQPPSAPTETPGQ